MQVSDGDGSPRQHLPGSRSGRARWHPFGVTTLWPDLRAGRAFRRDSLGFMLGLPEAGDLIRFKAGFTRFALIRGPELIHRVLVTDDACFGEGKWTQRSTHVLHDCLITRDGEPHRQRRADLQPSFAENRLATQDSAMVARTLRLAEEWREGEIVDVNRQMACLNLAIFVDTLFAVDLGGEISELERALQVMRRAMSKLPLPRPTFLAARRRVRQAIAGLRRGPMVEDLRQAGLGDDEIDDEIVAMLFASIDTTPSALTWTWFAIGRHQAVEAKLHAELSEVLGGRPPTFADLARLPYLKLILTEVLRLYPPVRLIDRRALEDIDLGGTRLHAGEYVLISPLLTHRDPRFFERPSSFWPERWQTEQSPEARRAYLPFGRGPHVCIGLGLAMRGMGLILATLAQGWRLKPAPGLPLEPSPQTAALPMILEHRAWMT